MFFGLQKLLSFAHVLHAPIERGIKSVNVLNRQVMVDLDAALDRVGGDATVKLLIIRGAKPSGFLAGADLNEFARIANSEEATALSARGQQLFDKLADLPMPTMAVI